MILGLTTLLVAISISLVSALYSIIGLMAIFAGAHWPIIIMGAALEAGKITSTIWLHYNWERAEWKIKTYLVIAVIILMVITSLGVFGFLSKAHFDQSVPSGDIQAQVQLFDEKIKTQRDNIDSYRKALTQLNNVVDQTMSRTTDDAGAIKSANLRRSQTKERNQLQQDIEQAQKQITLLQEQREPIASKFRQVVADVGPITYLAALIYGDKADHNMLEAAVRWVIIIIVLVFDPLAIVLILAATTSIDWSKFEKKKKENEEKEENTIKQSQEEINRLIAEAVAAAKNETADAIEKNNELELAIIESERLEEQRKLEAALSEKEAKITQLTEDLEKAIAMVVEAQDKVAVEPVAAKVTPAEDEQGIDTAASVSDQLLPLLPQVPERTNIVVPSPRAVPDHFPKGGNANFGVSFPDAPNVGDLFLRVDFLPSKLFKWNGDNWMETDRTITDSFAYDKEYIKLLVNKVSTGEYDIDELSQTEQDQIAEYLQNEQAAK